MMVGRGSPFPYLLGNRYREIPDFSIAVSEGLFGKITDTVNTAKDIAHVIWNVGWRSGR